MSYCGEVLSFSYMHMRRRIHVILLRSSVFLLHAYEEEDSSIDMYKMTVGNGQP
jgi:hypothetical protein